MIIGMFSFTSLDQANQRTQMVRRAEKSGGNVLYRYELKGSKLIRSSLAS